MQKSFVQLARLVLAAVLILLLAVLFFNFPETVILITLGGVIGILISFVIVVLFS